MLVKHVPDPQQLVPGDELQAVSQSESTVQGMLHAPPLSSPLGAEPEEFPGLPEVSSPLAPELLPEPELFPFTEASAPVFAFAGAKPPVELLFELPQAAMKPTAPSTVIRLRVEPIFIWRLPSAAPVFSVPHISVDELSWLGQSCTAQSLLMLS
jgi:hypothetical protein